MQNCRNYNAGFPETHVEAGKNLASEKLESPREMGVGMAWTTVHYSVTSKLK